MRLFVAIPVEGEVAQVLGELLDGWRREPWPVKWVRTEGLHLTLKFLGEVQGERAGALTEALGGAVQGTPALPFSLTDIGAFPPLPRARVLWAGLEADGALELLVHRIERTSESLGFPLEGQAYRPHVTLGRVREGARLPSAAIQGIEAVHLPRAGFLADRVVLYRSLTGAGGSRYEVEASFPLGVRS